MMKLSVIGLGKLGLCTAACFAKGGFKVIGVDVDVDKISAINKGVSPIAETGLPELLARVKKNLVATRDYREAILDSDISFIVVATPSLANGCFSNEYLEKALHRTGEALREKRRYHLVVITSTVMPQTIDSVVTSILETVSGKRAGRDFGIAYNPEFIALGSVIHDFLNPDFILIGEMCKKDGDMLEHIYRTTCEKLPRFARMSPLNAEITKIALNCYVTTKITFANSLALLCERLKGADAYVISSALGMDSRIGNRYIRPGLGYGGPCFPRDNVAFAAFARKLEAKAKLAEMVDEVNRDQVMRVVRKVQEVELAVKKPRQRVRVAVLGLSYKPDTPIVEDAQALDIAGHLTNEGFRVSVFDPQAQENALSVLGDSVTYAKSALHCLKGCDIAIIAVPWPEFKKIPYRTINTRMFIIDCWKLLDNARGARVVCMGVGG